MKGALRMDEPPSLATFRHAQPEGTWDEMKDDPHHGGQTAYREIKVSLVRSQRCLCAYCETRIAKGTTDELILESRRDQRVEHFHPKSDLNRPPNWALHWPNMWSVCHGGSDWPPQGEPLDSTRQLPPLEGNLTCDAFKDQQITKGALPNPPEGWLLSPDQIPAFPNLVKYAPDGSPEPDEDVCSTLLIPGNKHCDTHSIVAATFRHLNLGCTRLNRNRNIVRAQLEKVIKKARLATPGQPAALVMLQLARKIFPTDQSQPWPEFFTLLRWRIGEPAEVRLREVNYQG